MASYEETLNMIRRKKKNNTSSNISDTRARVYNSLGMSMPKKEQNANQNSIQKSEKSNRSWLNGGAFSDGYQFGDLTKTALGTVGDIGTNLFKGVLRAGESIGDLAAYGGAQVVDLFGAHDYADQVRKNAAEDLTGKLFKGVDKTVDKNSVLGEKTDDVISSIGNMYAQGITSAKLLGGKGNIPLSVGGKKFNLPVTSLISGASSGMGEAVQKNAEDWQVWANGITGGLAEGISESLFGTFGIGGSDLDDAIVNGITKNMKDGLVKTLTKSGIKAVGEGAEEVASYLLNYGSQHLMDYVKNNLGIKGVDLGEKFSNEELWENFFSGTLAAGLGGIPSTINTIRRRSSNINVNEGVNQFTIKNNVPVVENQSNKSNNDISLPTSEDIDNLSYNANLPFEKQIDKWSNKQWNSNASLLMFKEMPELYRNLGLNNTPLTISPGKLNAIVNGNKNHPGIGIDGVKQLPQKILNPLNILESSTVDNSIVVVTDLSDKKGNIVIATVAIDGYGNLELLDVNNKEYTSTKITNALTNAYGKDNYDTWIKNQKIIYDIDEGIKKQRVNGKWFQSPNAINSFSTNNNSTNNQQSQIAPLSTNSNMQKTNNLTQQEQTELNELNDLPFELSEEETNRKTYLENKSKGLIKYADLPTEVTFNDIKNQYSKYKNLSDFNSETLDKAKSFVPGYRNTERRTKAEWLEVAKFIGNNINADSSTGLEKYAIQSWHSAKPNIKENLNRQGSKFVKFTIDEWVNTIYKAAGVGETIQNNNVNETILPDENSIKVPKDGRNILYDINKIKKVDDANVSSFKGHSRTSTSMANNIAQSNDNVKLPTKYSQNGSQWQQYLDKNYKPSGTRTNMNDIRGDIKETQNNDILPPMNENTRKLMNPNNINETTQEDIKPIDEALNKYKTKLTRKEVQNQLINEMDIVPAELSIGDDIKSINYQLTDPIRVNEKVFGRELGKKINDATINQTKHNTAEKTRWLNKERSEISELGIKARSKESAAVQKYAEGQYVDEKNNIHNYGELELIEEFPNVETQEKIKKAAQIIRGKYDTYIDQINEVLVSLGYDAIPKRTDYMRHFQELGDIFSKTGIPFNLNDMSAEDLPTDINGLTEFNRPGKNWFASAQQRTGIKTTYDAITGIDGYLEGAGNIIFHTADIQRYRALSRLIRDTFGQTKGFDNLENLSGKELQQRIKDIQSNKLSKYVAWLDEQANNLAGKKAAIDRATERMIGRRGYTFLNTIKKQVGSNMTGYNVRSSLTNLISSTIASAKTNKIALVKGTISTINNMFKNDGFIDKSDFLTSRFGSDSLSPKLWQKISNAGQIFMTGTDYFTSNQIVRSKYFEGLQKGMNETEAIKYADDFASRVMGDRSQGSTSEIFNSKTLGLFTQFQLEVNNQWQYMIHDSKMDYQANSNINGGLKAGATMLFQLGQLAGFSYLFNELFESLTGSRAAFDPVEILKKLFGIDEDDEEKKSFEERLGEAGGLLADNIPFGNLFTGNGRIPISEALTPLETTTKVLTGGTDKYGNKVTWKDVGKDIVATVPYYILPTGYSQIKKTTKGLSMYDEKLPLAGSYTDSGNLRFNADETISGKVKAALFGQYSSKEAQNYIDSGFKTIGKNNIQEMKDLGMNSTEYREYHKGLSASGTKKADKIEYINSLNNVSIKQKNIMASNVLDRDIDMKEYQKYGSYQEYDYAYKNPEKYAVATAITSFDKYQEYTEKIKDIRENTKDDKNETIKYINSLNLNIPQKAMFIRQYYKSFNSYNKEIIEYVDSKYKTLAEKEKILSSLGFTIRDGRVYW